MLTEHFLLISIQTHTVLKIGLYTYKFKGIGSEILRYSR